MVVAAYTYAGPYSPWEAAGHPYTLPKYWSCSPGEANEMHWIT